jgi:hypothetical protein
MKLLLFFLAVLAVPALAQPVGMAVHVVGTVRLAHGGHTAPLRLLQRVENGDVVQCVAGGQAVIVLFANGARYEVKPGTSATIGQTAVAGAHALAALPGPSAEVVKRLGGARVGATMSRVTSSFQRLLPNAPGWFTSGHPHLEWLPLVGAASYTFTVFDNHDNVIWSTRTPGTSADFPAELPDLLPQRPYLWRLSGFGPGGKPLPESRWGLFTILTPQDSAALTATADVLLAQAKAGDTTSLLLLAEAYRSYGVASRALETLQDERLRGLPGLEDAKATVWNSLSPFARALDGSAGPLAK